MKYDTEMNFLNTIQNDYDYKVDRNIKLELIKAKKRVELNKSQDELPHLSSGQ